MENLLLDVDFPTIGQSNLRPNGISNIGPTRREHLDIKIKEKIFKFSNYRILGYKNYSNFTFLEKKSGNIAGILGTKIDSFVKMRSTISKTKK